MYFAYPFPIGFPFLISFSLIVRQLRNLTLFLIILPSAFCYTNTFFLNMRFGLFPFLIRLIFLHLFGGVVDQTGNLLILFLFLFPFVQVFFCPFSCRACFLYSPRCGFRHPHPVFFDWLFLWKEDFFLQDKWMLPQSFIVSHHHLFFLGVAFFFFVFFCIYILCFLYFALDYELFFFFFFFFTSSHVWFVPSHLIPSS